ncbi:MAG: NADPH:quinone reductase [bacterium]
MKAIRVHEGGGPEVMKLEEVADPKPGAGEVVVSVRAVGVNPVDAYLREGWYAKMGYPYTPGMDGAGEVEAVGEGVKKVATGERVYICRSLSGTYGEKALCKESQVHPLPQRLSFGQGAAIGIPYVTAYRALFQKAQAKLGETVLIHGATGGVGIAALQLGRAAGLIVIGTGGTERGRKMVAAEGARHVLDHKEPGYLDKIAGLTGGHGVDVILEMLANVNLGADLGLLAVRGRIVVIGSRGKVEINPRDMMGRDTSITSFTLRNCSEEDMAAIHAALGPGLADGTLRPIVGREIPLAEAPRAHVEVMKSGAFGKIVLIP